MLPSQTFLIERFLMVVNEVIKNIFAVEVIRLHKQQGNFFNLCGKL